MRLLFIAACMLVLVRTAVAQGTITWNNRITGSVDFRIADVYGNYLEGPGYTAQLWAGSIDGSPLSATTISSTFRTGAAAGYFNSLGDVAVDGFTGGTTVALQIRVWDNVGGTITSWNNAMMRGETPTYHVALGGAGEPPSISANLSAFGTQGALIYTTVPEPSTIALGALGIGALLMVRRRKA